MDKLKPCPFCGYDKIKVREAQMFDFEWYVKCPKCCARSEIFSREEDAAEAWNRRTAHE